MNITEIVKQLNDEAPLAPYRKESLTRILTQAYSELCEEVEKRRWKIPPDFLIAIYSEREQEIYNAGRREGENAGLSHAVGVIKSKMK